MTAWLLGGLVVVVISAIIWSNIRGRRDGAARVERDDALEALDDAQAIGEAAVNAPRGPGEVVKRLREKGL